MKLIVGLGNPGLKYAKTRHNVGFMAVAKLAKKHSIKINKGCCSAKVGRAVICGFKVILALPQRFMNLSGGPVADIIRSEHIKKQDLLVVCDDVNIEYGRLRIKPQGSSGGHNGLKSIIENLHSENFARLRIAVGKEGLKADITDFVLGDFTKEEKKHLAEILDRAVECCESWVKEEIQITAGKFNSVK